MFVSFKRTSRLFLILLVISTFNTNISAGASQGDGMLTAASADGSVTIGDRAYAVGAEIRILDRNGKAISIEDLKLPVKVHFEYEYTSRGDVIKLIQEFKEILKENP